MHDGPAGMKPQAAPDLQAEPFEPVLLGLDAAAPPAPMSTAQRLFRRVAKSAAAARALHTRRFADTLALALAPGVTQRALYRAETPQALRPGEPTGAMLVEMAPGTRLALPAAALQREWLVLHGSVQIGPTWLQEQDYHVEPAGAAAALRAGPTGAHLYQREAPSAPGVAWTQHAAGAPWADYGPGIRRRVMWQQGAHAAMLYRTQPGAAVPRHGHRHDEECLMLEGDVFLDDVLLRPLDYQIAPAGTEHQGVYTDTGVLLFAHGDVDLDLIPA
jgi:quercetin dioxygenase-like cupin family protein